MAQTETLPVALLEEPKGHRSWAKETLSRLAERRLAIVGAAVIALVILFALLAPLIAPYDPLEQDISNRLRGPTMAHFLGTDELGRDTLSRMIHGSRISLQVGIIAVGLAFLLGVPLGLIAGYCGGWVDNVIMRLLDAVLSFPALVLAAAMIAALGPGIRNVMIAIGIVYTPTFARLVRGSTLSVKEWDSVLAARALGASGLRIVSRHIWPNVTAPVIVQASLGAAYAIIAEAGLSFLGLGVQPPEPAWGSMLRAASTFMRQAPILSIVPGAMIVLSVLAFNFLGDGLRDALDPRLRGR